MYAGGWDAIFLVFESLKQENREKHENLKMLKICLTRPARAPRASLLIWPGTLQAFQPGWRGFRAHLKGLGGCLEGLGGWECLEAWECMQEAGMHFFFGF